MLEALERSRREMCQFSAEAHMYTSGCSDIVAQLVAMKPTLFTTDRKYVNPNMFGLARWRWVWAIERVLLVTRVARHIKAIWSRYAYHLFYYPLNFVVTRHILVRTGATSHWIT